MILIACMVQAGACREVILMEGCSIHTCMVQGQQLAAQWIGQNPGYRVKRIDCRVPAA